MMRHTQSGGNGCLIAPEVFDPVRRQLGVHDRVLDVLVAEPCLQHMREDGEGHTGAPTEALEQRAEALGRHWAAALTGEHVWRCLLLTLQAVRAMRGYLERADERPNLGALDLANAASLLPKCAKSS